MSLVFSLKVLCDLCFYLSFAHVIGGYFGAGDGVFLALPVFAAAAALSAALKEKGAFRFLPEILLLALLYLPGMGLAGLLLLSAPACYLTALVAKGLYEPTYEDQKLLFPLFFKLYGPFLVFMFIFGQFSRLEQWSIPYMLLYVILSVVLLRMLRHQKEVLMDKKFRLFNALALTPVIVAAVFLGTPYFRALLAGAVKVLYFRIIVPLVTLVAFIMVILLYPLAWLFGRMQQVSEISPSEAVAELGFSEYVAANQVSFDIRWFFYTLLFLGVAALLIRFFQKLMPGAGQTKTGDGIVKQYIPLDGDDPQAKKGGTGFNKVRKIYRKFLLLCSNENIPVAPSDTSRTIEQKAAGHFSMPGEAARMRDIYIDVRYGGGNPDKERIKAMRALYASFKEKAGPRQRAQRKPRAKKHEWL